jgi:uncharacterized protein YkwD
MMIDRADRAPHTRHDRGGPARCSIGDTRMTAGVRFAGFVALACAFLALSAPPALARSKLLDEVNALRAAGCGGQRGAKTPLRANRKLDSVAKRIARGQQLSDALSATGYRALHSASMFLSNTKDDANIARTLAQRACSELRNENVRDLGVEKRGGNVWLVIAEPFAADALENVSKVSQRVIDLANEARARPRRCGSKQFAAVPPLVLEKRLTEAARVQARDMAKNNMLSHTGSDGSSPAQRATRAGYQWRVVGENVASGPTTPEEVMEGWLASPGHCENLMSPRFTEMGIAYVVDAKSASGVYWSQMFGAPRK